MSRNAEPDTRIGVQPMKSIVDQTTRGYLRDIGIFGTDAFTRHRYCECNDCGTRYPDLHGFGAGCNGKAINKCLCVTSKKAGAA